MFASTRSRRLLAGGAAFTAGVAVVAGPAVTSLAGADPVDDTDGAATPQALPDPGDFESCTAYFGLGKDTSDLVSYDVVVVDDAITPTPVVGEDLIPVLTVQGEGGLTAQCIPELGWTDQDSFEDYVEGGIPPYSYPGTGYYLIPATYGWEADTPQGAFVPTSTSIEFLHELPSSLTVTWSPQQPNAVENGYVPIFNDFDLSPSDPAVVATVADITAVDDDAAAGALAQQFLTTGDCDDSDPALPGLADALSVLFDEAVAPTCFETYIGTGIYYRSVLTEGKVDQSLVVVTITGPTTPTTPTTAGPGVDPAGAVEVPPTFTG